MITVVIYDDHDLPRESLGALLSSADDMTCIGSFENANHVIEQIRSLRPDIVLMDIEMPGIDGISAVKMIKKEFPEVRIIMQTVFEDEARIFSSLQAGAEGYILKNASAEKIIESIREVHAGGASMTPSVALRVMKFFNQTKSAEDYSLTNKEKEVLALLAEGNSYKMAAAKLGITYSTVNSHIKNIYEKLHVHSLGEAVSIALKNKIV